MRNQNLVTSSNAHGDALAITVKGTRANSQDVAGGLVLKGAFREEDAGGGLSLRLDALNQNAIQEGSKALDVADERLLNFGLAKLQGKSAACWV